MKKIVTIVLIIICFSTVCCYAMYKIMKEEDVFIEVDCMDVNTFRGMAFQVMDNNKNNKCGVEVSDKGLTFLDNKNNYIKYEGKLYTFNIVKKEFFVYSLTDGEKNFELDYLKEIKSGSGTKDDPYIIE